MALNEMYLMTDKNVEKFFNSLQVGQAPEKFTTKYLETLGFASSNDRLFIKLLKVLSFLDDSGTPTQRYFEFLDSSRSKIVMAEAIKESYSDLFTINKKAYEWEREEVKNKLRSLTQGKKSDKVLSLMAMTFLALCEYADWKTHEKEKKEKSDSEHLKEVEVDVAKPDDAKLASHSKAQFHYTIQIHLPESRDVKVFDAIFESMKKHIF